MVVGDKLEIMPWDSLPHSTHPESSRAANVILENTGPNVNWPVIASFCKERAFCTQH